MFSVLILNLKNTGNTKFFYPPQNRFLPIILILFAIATFFTPAPDWHIQATINYLKLCITYFIAYKLIDDIKKLDVAIWGFMFGSWYLSFVAFQIGRNSGDRVEGIGTVDAQDSNGIALAIAPALIFCFHYFFVTENKYLKALFMVAGVFIANGLVLINSRGAFLGAFLGLSYYVWNLYFSHVKGKRQGLWATLIVVTGFFGALSIMDDSFLNRMHTIVTTEQTETQENAATRTFFWMAAVDMVKDFPFGAGVDGFIYFSSLYIPEHIHTGGSRNRAVHSTWFEALSEIGYLGFFVLCLMVYYSFKTLSKIKKKLPRDTNRSDYYRLVAIQSAFITFVIGMTFVNRLRADVFYWCILYSACAYSIYAQEFVPLSKGKKR